MKNKLIAVLLGGWNSEREVSLSSGEGVFNALQNLGYQAVKIDYSPQIFEQLKEAKPDIVFNALHGKYGEDGHAQAVCDILKIPYTHSGVTTSALCMDKIITRHICATVGVVSPQFTTLKKGEDLQNQDKIAKMTKPFVIKPISEGSSVGIEIIMPNDNFDITNYDWQYGDEIIIEKYLAGQEVHIAIMDGKALGGVEVRPKGLFYDYNCKYTAGMTDYLVPPQISDEKLAEVMKLAEKCHEVTGCRGISRVDFILNNGDGGDDNFYLLEVNTQPGLTPTSLVPKIAKNAGISFGEIVEYLVKTAQVG